jgi:predicted TPR repeat methyltransferase
MKINEGYNIWAAQYDTNNNKTRDLEAKALRFVLNEVHFCTCLEIGCGTGKNTSWLITKATQITAIDFSEEMLIKAKEKIKLPNVIFIQSDIIKEWNFTHTKYDLIVFSLVLEHIKDLDFIFKQAAEKINDGGTIYIGEFHPFKQYTGSKARFELEGKEQELTCYTHHISELIQSAKKYGFNIVDVQEFFDDDDSTTIPRILTLIFQKK